jgi:drug/metabolite transporter superfamily protein YnfA
MPADPPADASGPISLALAGLVLVAAAFLAWRQWRDVRTRPADLPPLDRNHFARQDLRRVVGTIVLALLGVAIAFGGQMPHMINGQANTKFIQLWAGVAFLIAALLMLAMLDWISTRLYFKRHRQRLTNEGLSIVEAELRLKLEMQRRRPDHFDGRGPNGYPHPPSEN